MALVDPLIPQPQSRQRSKPVQHVSHARLRPAVQPAAAPQPQTPSTTQQPRPPARKTFTPPPQRPNHLKTITQAIAMLLWASALGFGAYSQTIGELAIAAYALVAWLLRVSSQTSFVLALVAFVATAGAQLLKPGSTLAANFAVYAFLLLVVGSVSLGLEVRQQAKWQRPQGQRGRRN